MTMSKTILILAMLVLTTLEARAEAPPASSPQTGSPAVLALESLADKGSARAQFELGKRLEFGIGIDRSLDRAAQFYCGAAEQGHGEAALHLGRFYLAGTGVPRDGGRAAAWLRVAAGQGLTEAGALLARGAAGADPRIPATCRPPRFTPIPIYAPVQIRRMVEKLAPRFGLDAKLVLSVIQTESAYRQDAVSPRNAMGLMQLIPET